MHACICPAEGADYILKLRIHDYIPQSPVHSSLEVNIPNPVRGGRWDVDSQRPAALLHLHGEQQGRVGHLLHLLLNELRLCSLLEVLRLGYFVHKTHDLAWSVASHVATWADDENAGGGREGRSESGSSFIHNSISCYPAPTVEGSDWVLH